MRETLKGTEPRPPVAFPAVIGQAKDRTILVDHWTGMVESQAQQKTESKIDS